MKRPSSQRLALAVASFLCCLPGVARAGYRPRVVLLTEPVESERAAEVEARVRGELEAADFELYVRPIPADVDPKIAVESSARDLHPAAVLLVDQEVSGDLHTAELWVSDRSLSRTFVQRLRIDHDNPHRGATWLAVQAVELVRARLAELSLTPPPRDPAPPTVDRGVTPPPGPERRGQGAQLSAGLGLLHNFGREEPSFTPLLRASVSLPEQVSGDELTIDLRLSGSALGGEPEVSDSLGNATLEQAFGSLDAVFRFVPTFVVQPFLSVGNGFYTVDVTGHTSAPNEANRQRTWSGMTALGAGVWLEPFPGGELVLEAQLMAAWSETIVRMNEREVADVGAPMGLLSIGLGAVF